jgi:hypothetical protein
MSSTMNGNRQEGKILTIEYKALKWAKMNITLTSSMADGMIMTSLS